MKLLIEILADTANMTVTLTVRQNGDLIVARPFPDVTLALEALLTDIAKVMERQP